MPEPLAVQVIERLTERGLSLATAEASVGGMIGHWLTDVPGASRVFVGGIAAYGNQPKLDLLHVSPEVMQNHGAVSELTVSEMAEGARDAMGTDLGVAESGITSPNDNPERPGGLFYIAVVGPGLERVERHLFSGSREEIKRQATEAVLRLVLDYLDGSTPSEPAGGGAAR